MDNVYIKGISSITPWGINEEKFPAFSDQMKSAIDFLPSDYGWQKLNRVPKPIRLGCVGIGEALLNAGYTQPIMFGEKEAERTGLIVASSFTNLEAICSLTKEAKQYGVQYVNPSIFPNTVLNIIAGQASIYFKIQGANITVSNGQASGWKALLYAHDLLLGKQLDRVIVCELRLNKPTEFEPMSEEFSEPETVNTIILENQGRANHCIQVEMKSIHEKDFYQGKAHQDNPKQGAQGSLLKLVSKARDLQKLNQLIEDRFSIIENNEWFSITMKKESGHL